MKIRELLEAGLTGIKKYQDMQEFEFRDVLKQYGFKVLDVGTHAIVFYRDNDPFVYRVAKNDSPYEMYVEFLLKTPPNPHYPKIYGIKNIPDFFKRSFLQRWSQFNVVKVEYIPHSMNAAEFKEFDEAYVSSYLVDGILHSASDPQGKWRSLATALYKVFDNVPAAADVHKRNFGKRADGTFVILDPVWEGETPYQAYDRAQKMDTDWYADDDPVYISGRWDQKREKANQQQVQYDPELEDMPF